MSTVVDQPTLPELAALINSELAAADVAFRATVDHAIRAGEYLIQARPMVPYGEWANWTQANLGRHPSGLYSYMRLARYADDVRAGNYDTIAAAVASVRGRPTFAPPILKVDLEVARELKQHVDQRRRRRDRRWRSAVDLYSAGRRDRRALAAHPLGLRRPLSTGSTAVLPAAAKGRHARPFAFQIARLDAESRPHPRIRGCSVTRRDAA
jgi:hypothetical protein